MFVPLIILSDLKKKKINKKVITFLKRSSVAVEIIKKKKNIIKYKILVNTS